MGDVKVIRRVLDGSGLVAEEGNTNPGAVAWIVHKEYMSQKSEKHKSVKQEHWYAYTQTAQGEWFNVDSIFDRGQDLDCDHKTEKCNCTGPRYIGGTDDMMAQIQNDAGKLNPGNRHTVYRVAVKEQSAQSAEPEEVSDTSGRHTKWNCATCTLENVGGYNCVICMAARPRWNCGQCGEINIDPITNTCPGCKQKRA